MEKEAILYSKHHDGKVTCLACEQKCLISNGKTGLCGVRKNILGKLFLNVYGKLAAVNIDPIEKKPIYHYLSGTRTYSIGTVGCNFKCDFCQNWDISQVSKDSHGKMIFGREMIAKEVVENAIKKDCKSISYTYNEPIVFVEFIKDCCIIAKKKGLKNIMVTNGYWSKESFEFISKYIDAVNIDLKGDEEFYKKYCGGKFKPVLDTIKRCFLKGMHVEITTLLMDSINDNEETLKKIAMFIAGLDKNIPWHISRFFPRYKMLENDMTSRESMERAYNIGKDAGLKNVYLGNV